MAGQGANVVAGSMRSSHKALFEAREPAGRSQANSHPQPLPPPPPRAHSLMMLR